MAKGNIILCCAILILVQIDHHQCSNWFLENDLDVLSSSNDTEAWILCDTRFPQFRKILNETILSADKCRATCKFNDHLTNPVMANQPDGKSCQSAYGNHGVCSKGYCLDMNDPFSACNALDDIRGNVQKSGTKFIDQDHCKAQCQLSGWSPVRNVNDGQPCDTFNDSMHFCSAGVCIVQTLDDMEATKLCDSLPDINGNVDKLGSSFADKDKCKAKCSVNGYKQDKVVNDGKPCASTNDTKHLCSQGICVEVSEDDIEATKACNELPEIRGTVEIIGSKFADPDRCKAHCKANGFTQDKNVNNGKQCATKKDDKHLCFQGACLELTDDEVAAFKACDELVEIKGNVDKVGNTFEDKDKCQAKCSINGYKQHKNVNDGRQCAAETDKRMVCHSGTCTSSK